MAGFVAVHVGAGYHSNAKTPMYLKLVKECCKEGLASIKDLRKSKDVVCEMVKLLEDSALSNAGYGSNLTLDGKVQCDAAIMTDNGDFAAVGAVEDINNPIAAAHCLLKMQRNATLKSVGMIPPLVLVGDCARDWALQNGIKRAEPKTLISKESFKNYQRTKSKLRHILQSSEVSNEKSSQFTEHTAKHKTDTGDSSEELLHSPVLKKAKQWDDGSFLLDTVGAVCLDSFGNVACAISSGGPLLKQPGRMGHAAVYGAGCWADQGMGSISTTSKVATTTTGCGEHIIKTSLAKELSNVYRDVCSDTNLATDVDKFLSNNFLNHHSVCSEPNRLCGVLSVVVNNECQSSGNGSNNVNIDLIAAHTSASFCIGWMSSACSSPTGVMSRMTDDKGVGASVVTNVFHCQI